MVRTPRGDSKRFGDEKDTKVDKRVLPNSSIRYVVLEKPTFMSAVCHSGMNACLPQQVTIAPINDIKNKCSGR